MRVCGEGVCMRVGIDFDGTLCKREGIPRAREFADSLPMENALEAVKELSKKFELYVFTNRKDKELIELWLHSYGFPPLRVTSRKLSKTIAYIDDRAIRFTNWLDICKYFL